MCIFVVFADTEIVVRRAHDTHSEFNDTTLKLKICGELLNLDEHTHTQTPAATQQTFKNLQKQNKNYNNKHTAIR